MQWRWRRSVLMAFGHRVGAGLYLALVALLCSLASGGLWRRRTRGGTARWRKRRNGEGTRRRRQRRAGLKDRRPGLDDGTGMLEDRSRGLDDGRGMLEDRSRGLDDGRGGLKDRRCAR